MPATHPDLLDGRQPASVPQEVAVTPVLQPPPQPRTVSPPGSGPLQIVLVRACLCGRGACADFTLKPAGVIETNPTEWPPLPLHQHTHTHLTHSITRQVLAEALELTGASRMVVGHSPQVLLATPSAVGRARGLVVL